MMSEGFKGQAQDLFNNQLHSDITVIVDDGSEGTVSVHAHRLVLATMSDYFRTMLYGQFIEANRSEIQLHDVQNCTFQHCLRYMYCGWDDTLDKMTLNEGFEFYSMSRMFLMDAKVKTSYCEWISDNFAKWESQIWTIFSMAIECDLPRVMHCCKDYISDIAIDLLTADEFLTVPLSVVQNVLSCEKLNCAKNDLKKAINRWISHNDIDGDIKEKLLEFVRNKKAPFYKARKLNLFNPSEPYMPQANMDSTTANSDCRTSTEPTLSYSSVMSFGKCIILTGVSIVFKRNPNADEASQKTKTKIALKVEIKSIQASTPCVSRTVEIICDLRKHATMEARVFFSKIQLCAGIKHTFKFSWTGEGVQPILHKFGRSMKPVCSTEYSYILGIYKNLASSSGRFHCDDCQPYDRNGRRWIFLTGIEYTDSDDSDSDQMSF